MRVFLRVAICSIAFALTAVPALAQTLEAAYVLLGGNGAVARAVYTGTTDCPALSIDGATQTMNVRMAPQTGERAPFPVLVCELAIPAAATTVTLNGQPLPLPPPATAKLATIAVIGDTGCRLKAGKEKNPRDKDYEEDGKFQDCKSDWPFSALAASVAEEKPQLLVHVGDYIYRESKCPPHDKGCKGSPHGDNWLTWQADFFAPAKPLLAAAPWLATRGNHETCSRAGDGFMLFLDPTLAVNQQPAPCGALLESFSVTVGGQQFVMLDSSNAPDECVSEKKAAKGKKKKEVVCDLEKNLAPNCPKSGCSAKDYADQFAAMKPAAGAWLVSHRPAWGFKNKGKPLNATLQLALRSWSGQLPPGFALAAAGHIHIWEALSFKDKGAPQFVLGNGGTLLTHKVDRKLKGQKVGGREVHDARTSHKWGFTIFAPATDGWTVTSYSVKGKDKFECSVAQGALSCP